MTRLGPRLWCVLFLVAACARPAEPTVPEPQRIADRFVHALRKDDPDAAYALLSAELRASVDRDRFDALWRDNRPELVELAEEIARTDAPIKAHARVEVDDAEEIVLVLEDGRWRLAGGVLDAQSLETPLDAIAALRRALLRQSLPALLRVLSRERRAAWTASFERSMEQTADPLSLEVEVEGDEARVRLNSGGEVLLKREAGRWHVWDVR